MAWLIAIVAAGVGVWFALRRAVRLLLALEVTFQGVVWNVVKRHEDVCKKETSLWLVEGRSQRFAVTFGLEDVAAKFAAELFALPVLFRSEAAFGGAVAAHGTTLLPVQLWYVVRVRVALRDFSD